MTGRTVVFDVGGVIVRWQPLWLMREHLPSVATDDASAREVAAQVFQSWAADADWVAFDLGRIEPDDLARRITARTGYAQREVAALVAAIPAHLEPMPESLALIERLRAAGHRLALLSNMPRPYADHLEATHACFGWFEHRAWSGRLGLVKPQRAIFDHLQRMAGFEAARAMFLDDHVGNVEAAGVCGWNALRFESAAQCAAALEREGWL